MTMMDSNDQGHRYGNFPNYYSFNPPRNRLQVLEQKTNILQYIRNGLIKTNEGDDGDDGDDDDDGTMNEAKSKKPRREEEENQPLLLTSLKSSSKSSSKSSPPRRIIYYCDLGCNEGDLTVAMASSLIKKSYNTPSIINSCNTNTTTNYNKSNANNTPTTVDNPLPINTTTKDIVESIPSSSSSNATSATAAATTAAVVKCLGLDIDPALIERANAKFSSSSSVATPRSSSGSGGTSTSTPSTTITTDNVKATFKACNLCQALEHDAAYTSYKSEEATLFSNGSSNNVDNNKDGRNNGNATDTTAMLSRLPSPLLFHVTTIFSTTMWIHVHAGDDGLRQFIERACRWTRRFVLIEPQPSGCYRKANVRLRKMGRPELDDVTSSRLAMRPDIEKSIGMIMVKCGFRKVTLEEMRIATNCGDGGDGDGDDDDENGRGKSEKKREEVAAVTSWNRSLDLYERVRVVK